MSAWECLDCPMPSVIAAKNDARAEETGRARRGREGLINLPRVSGENIFPGCPRHAMPCAYSTCVTVPDMRQIQPLVDTKVVGPAESALALHLGLADGLSAEQIRSAHGISRTDYDSARKRMRRTLLREALAQTPRSTLNKPPLQSRNEPPQKLPK
jgi:hypothetical protein